MKLNNHLNKYLNTIVNYYDKNFSCYVLETYALKYIENYINGHNDGVNVVNILGNLAFLYRNDSIENERIFNFTNHIFDKIEEIDYYLANHISNFMEIVLNKNTKMIQFYIEKLDDNIEFINEDIGAILYKAAVIPSFNKKMPSYELVEKFKYPWRSYYELCICYNYYNNNMMALKYINKAVNTCPESLLKKYITKKKELLSKYIL